jgi:transglutaminase-like putative cysteine protease
MRSLITICVLIGGLVGSGHTAGQSKSVELVKTRKFFFTYAATVKNLPAAKTANIWLPVPSSSPEQEVTIEARDLPIRGRFREARTREDKVYGNRFFYMETQADSRGSIPLHVTYLVSRREVTSAGERFLVPPSSPEKIARFLQLDRRVPVSGKPLQLLKGVHIPKDEHSAARLLYQIVERHMRYAKEGTGWGEGDAVWACDSKFGNCSDFHSLFIALARSQKIPAKFEIGFAIPPKRGAGKIAGYHCWAWFLEKGKGWAPVDIAEAKHSPVKADYYFGSLPPDRVGFSTGRDIILDPPQKGPPLNFFVYPYVEVDGSPYPGMNVETAFSFQDIP